MGNGDAPERITELPTLQRAGGAGEELEETSRQSPSQTPLSQQGSFVISAQEVRWGSRNDSPPPQPQTVDYTVTLTIDDAKNKLRATKLLEDPDVTQIVATLEGSKKYSETTGGMGFLEEVLRRIYYHESFVRDRIEAILNTPEPPKLLLAPRVYKVRELGRGGFGAAYLVVEDRNEKVLKLLHVLSAGESDEHDEQKQKDMVILSRFDKEVEIMRMLKDRRVVPVPKFLGERPIDGHPGYYMEHLKGYSLQKLLSAAPPNQRAFSDSFVAHLGTEIALRMHDIQHVEDPPIAHRDLSPGNIQITDDGEPDILDLGLAKDPNSQLTQSGEGMGTPGYQAPEVLSDSRQTTTKADVFSLGCILCRMLTGKTPFHGGSSVSLLLAHADPDREADLANVEHPGMKALLEKMLNKMEPAKRPSMVEVAEELWKWMPENLRGKSFEEYAKEWKEELRALQFTPSKPTLSSPRDRPLVSIFANPKAMYESLRDADAYEWGATETKGPQWWGSKLVKKLVNWGGRRRRGLREWWRRSAPKKLVLGTTAASVLGGVGVGVGALLHNTGSRPSPDPSDLTAAVKPESLTKPAAKPPFKLDIGPDGILDRLVLFEGSVCKIDLKQEGVHFSVDDKRKGASHYFDRERIKNILRIDEYQAKEILLKAEQEQNKERKDQDMNTIKLAQLLKKGCLSFLVYQDGAMGQEAIFVVPDIATYSITKDRQSLYTPNARLLAAVGHQFDDTADYHDLERDPTARKLLGLPPTNVKILRMNTQNFPKNYREITPAKWEEMSRTQMTGLVGVFSK